MSTIPNLAPTLQHLFTTQAETLARRTGLVQRLGAAQFQADGALFAQTLVFGWLAHPQASLEALVQTATVLGVAISAQGLDQRCTEAAAAYLEALLAAAVQGVIAADPVAIPLLPRFSAVVLLDSSTISLPAALALWWPGCTAGTAALKLAVRYDLCRGGLEGPLLHDGRTSDQRTPLQTAALPPGRCAGATGLLRAGGLRGTECARRLLAHAPAHQHHRLHARWPARGRADPA